MIYRIFEKSYEQMRIISNNIKRKNTFQKYIHMVHARKTKIILTLLVETKQFIEHYPTVMCNKFF